MCKFWGGTYVDRKLGVVGAVVVVAVMASVLLVTDLGKPGGGREAGTITVTDMAGREVEVPEQVDRVVTTFPGVLRPVVALGCTDKVVGVSGYIGKKRFADKLEPSLANPELTELPSVSMKEEVNFEKIVELNPDVVFVFEGWSDLTNRIEEKTGIPAVCTSFYHDPYRVFEIVGKVLDRGERAAELDSYMRTKLSRIENITSDIPESERPTCFLASWMYHPFNWAGTNYMPLQMAGGLNVAENLRGEEKGLGWAVEISKEKIVGWDPEFVFIHSGSPPPEEVLSNPQLKTVDAVEKGRVYPIIAQYVGQDPAGMVADTYYIAKLLYPDKFDYDMEKVGNQIYEEFYAAENLYNRVDQNRGINLHRWG